jgi:hypothetical protein
MAESHPGALIATVPSRQQTFVNPEIRGMHRMLGSEPQCYAMELTWIREQIRLASRSIGVQSNAAVPCRHAQLVDRPKPALMAAGAIRVHRIALERYSNAYRLQSLVKSWVTCSKKPSVLVPIQTNFHRHVRVVICLAASKDLEGVLRSCWLR